jgi:glycogen(starch) synthase
MTGDDNPSPMNVLMVAPWDGKLGGVIAVVKHLAEHLVQAGHNVTFFHPGDSDVPREKVTELGFPGVEMRLPFRPTGGWTLRALLELPFRFPITVIRVLGLLRKYRIDVVNVHFPIGDFVYFGVCRRLTRTRLVTSIHGADLFPRGRARDSNGVTLPLLMRASDLVVAPSSAFLRASVEVFPYVATRGRTIHNGIDMKEFAVPTASGEPAAHNGADRVVLTIAQLDPRKGLDVLIRAFAPIHEWDSNITLQVAGEGPILPELQALVEELRLGDSVRFLGQLPRDEIARVLQQCEVFVLASRSESFGIAAVEAMASAKPVIVSTADGLAEVVEDGVSGLAVPPDDVDALACALKQVLASKDLQTMLSRNGLRRAHERFSSELMGRTYEATYREALAAR